MLLHWLCKSPQQSIVVIEKASLIHARMRAEERSEPLPTFAARRLIQCGRCVRFSCCCHGECAMTKRPKTSRPIEINPDVMATFSWTVFREAGSPLIINGGKSLKLIVSAGGGLDFQDDVTVPTG